MKTLEATEAAVNLAKVLNQVHVRRELIEIVKQGIPYAYLIPALESGTRSHDLAEGLADAKLSVEDRSAFANATRMVRISLKPLKNPWG